MTNVDETVNNAIVQKKGQAAIRQLDMGIDDVHGLFEKGRKDPIGTVRNGKRKVAEGKWVNVVERKTPPSNGESQKKPSTPKKDEPKSKKKFTMPSHVSRHHIGTLRHIKSLASSGKFAEAHSLAEGLPDDIKHEIPIPVWQKMIAGSHDANIKEQKATEKKSEPKIEFKKKK